MQVVETKQQPPYPLRMPAELRESLTKFAEDSGLSLNAEIVARLTAGIEGIAARELTLAEIVDALTRGHAHTLKDGGVTIKIEVTSNSDQKIFPTREAYDEGMARLDKADASRAAASVSGGTKRGRSQKKG